MGRKFRGLGSHHTQSPLGWGLPPYQVASWFIQPFGYNRYGPKIGGSAPLWERGAGSHLTQWPGLRPTCVPSFILIRRTVWPQCTNVTDRTDRQRIDSIRRTVLQTVAQKWIEKSCVIYRTLTLLMTSSVP